MRAVRSILGSLLIFQFFLAVPLFAQRDDIEIPAASDLDLTIGNIEIILSEIFEDPRNAFYRTVNDLKIQTRKAVIRRELLFREGETLNEFALSESERVLRRLGYLRNVDISYHPRADEPSIADVKVRVQDTWTIIPQISFSSGDGRDRTSIGIAESNLLGHGKRIETGYRKEEGSDTIQVVYDDRNLFNSRQQLQLGYFDGNDGNRFLYEFGDPYRSLIQDDAWGTQLDVFDGIGRLYENGDERFIYREKSEEYGIGYSFSMGDPESRVYRYTFGYQYQSNTFSQARDRDFSSIGLNPDDVSRDPALLASNRRYSGPYFGIERIEQDFVSMAYIDRFSRVEDFNIGRVVASSIQLAPVALGSRDDALLINAEYSAGHRIDSGSFVRGELSGSSRYQDGGFENSLIHTEAKYFNVLGPVSVGDIYLGKHTLVASTFFDYGIKLDLDRELLIGADNALRGYDARTFTGDKRFALNLEDRMHFIENAWDLISIGGAAFFEIGGATNRAAGRLFTDELYSDVGVGLRFAFPRSSGERVLRMDLAYPLRDGPDGSNRFELRLIFSSGQLFSGRLRSEAAAQRRASIDF